MTVGMGSLTVTRVLVAIGFAAVNIMSIAGRAGPAAAQAPTLTRVDGTLPDGTPWEIVVPSNWNGTLLVDLDFASSQTRYATLHARGFAGAGIRREGGAGDARANSDRFIPVLDIFAARFGKPARTIANGRSRGGVTSVVMMETYPERIDGALTQCTVSGYIPSYNGKLDHAFAARVLLETDLAIVDIPTASAEYSALTSAWSNLITAAQATPQGKARIALAHALGQLPVWTNPNQPRPDPSSDDQMQQAMFDTLRAQFLTRLGVRRDYEQASGGVFNWNTGVDYAKIFNEMVRRRSRRSSKGSIAAQAWTSGPTCSVSTTLPGFQPIPLPSRTSNAGVVTRVIRPSLSSSTKSSAMRRRRQ